MPTISIRVDNPGELEEIDRRAGELGITRSELMRRAALDVATADEERLRRMEDRLDLVERALFDLP